MFWPSSRGGGGGKIKTLKIFQNVLEKKKFFGKNTKKKI